MRGDKHHSCRIPSRRSLVSVRTGSPLGYIRQMKPVLFALLPSLLLACRGKPAADSGTAASATDEGPLPTAVLDAISLERIKADVDLLASDDFAGRAPGSVGHAAALAHLETQMQGTGLEPAGTAGGFIIEVPMDPISQFAPDETGTIVPVEAAVGYDLAGMIRGSEAPDELVIIMSHYDHLGTTAEGAVFNGAIDDMTATAVLIEVARTLIEEVGPFRRSVLFLITDGEEGGLQGAEGWLDANLVDTNDIVVAISVDPLGRRVLPSYGPIILMGGERAPLLKEHLRGVSLYADSDVAFVNRDQIPVFSSDQDPFWRLDEPVPALWFTSPGMTWYHTVDDTPETVDYRSVKAHSRYLAMTIASLANSEERFEDTGPQPLSVEDIRDALELLDGVVGSGDLTAAEISTLGSMQAIFEEVDETGEIANMGAVEGAYLRSAIMLLLELTQDHPGEVPPPWPE
jgi:hypothetical protein